MLPSGRNYKIDRRTRRLRVETLEDRRMLAVITVDSLEDNTLDDGLITLREAIHAANTDTLADLTEGVQGGNGDDIIEFDPTLFQGDTSQTISLSIIAVFDSVYQNSALHIFSSLTIQGPGANLLTVDASATDITPEVDDGLGARIFLIDDDDNDNDLPVIISGLTLTGGENINGGGGAILNYEDLTIAQSTVTDNWARDGGGAIDSSSLGSLSVYESQFINNRNESFNGGAIYATGGNAADPGLVIADSVFIENITGSRGGAVYTTFSLIERSTFSDNIGGNGGAIHATSLTISDSTITGNTAGTGGGISHSWYGTLSMTNTVLSDNHATNQAGAIYSGNLVMESSLVIGNTSDGRGGGLVLREASRRSDTILITRSTISDNESGIDGGGIWVTMVEDLDIRIEESTIAGNRAADKGGGIGVFGQGAPTFSISDSLVSANFARGDGGGISAVLTDESAIELLQATISGNSADREGGGVFIQTSDTGEFKIAHSTITRNIADANGNGFGFEKGGGISASGSGTLAIDHSIVAGNFATPPHSFSSPISDIASTIASITVSYSLIGSNLHSTLAEAPLGSPDAQGNLVGDFFGQGLIAPLLGVLADNGGVTKTHALLNLPGVAVSPAIDSGDSGLVTPLLTDQRSDPFVRVYDGDGIGGATIDMGAYEYQQLASPPALVVDTLIDESDGDYSLGDLSLREAIGLANGNVGVAETITFDTSLLNGTIELLLGELRVADDLNLQGLGSSLLTVDAARIDLSSSEEDSQGRGLFTVSLVDQFASGNSAPLEVEISGISLTNVGQSGSAAVLNYESLLLQDVSIRENQGVGIRNNGELTVQRSEISRNSEGGIDSDNALEIIDSDITHNSLRGGVFSFGTLVMSGSRVSYNSFSPDSNYSGGGLFLWREATISQSTISHNTAPIGGGIYNAAELSTRLVEIIDSTISSNHATSRGGGIYSGRQIKIHNSTLSGNTSDGSGGALAVSLFRNAAEISNSTITANVADYSEFGLGTGGGVWLNQGDSLILNNTIVANNRLGSGTASDISAFPDEVTAHYSLIGDKQGTDLLEAQTPDANGNLIGSVAGAGLVNPVLGPLQDNGGPTHTHALLPGSPAIDMGDPAFAAPPDYDQRGAPYNRVNDGRVDIGAHEAGTIVVTTQLDLVDPEDDLTSLREAIQYANILDGANTIVFSSLFDTPQTIFIDSQLPVITEDLTIEGPGMDLLTIDAGDGTDGEFATRDGYRILEIGASSQLFVVRIQGLTLTGGDVDEFGGAIGNRGELTLTEVRIAGNAAISGGGVSDSGVVVLRRSIVSGNLADHRGGGMKTSNAMIFDSFIESNTAQFGGGIDSGRDLQIIRSSVSGNIATAEAGGVYFSANFGALEIVDSTISGNRSIGKGGGLRAHGFGSIDITGSTFSGNAARYGGGAIYDLVTSTSIKNSTISGNSTEGNGGGIQSGSMLSIDSSTIVMNSADEAGGGIWKRQSTSSITNSIVSANTALQSPNLSGVFTESSFNLIDGAPLLSPLRDNGGPTYTHALLPGSPAIDMGDPTFAAPPDFDQRGAPFDRVYNGRIDIGAYESQPLMADYNGDNRVDSKDLFWLQINGGDMARWNAEYGLSATREAQSLVVTTEQDVVDPYDGLTSLREAINYANSLSGADEITFSSLFDTPQTILLTQGELPTIIDDLIIDGPGRDLLTIDASGNDPTPDSTRYDGDNTNDGDGSRIFTIDDDDRDTNRTVTMRGLALRGGDSPGWGGAINSMEDLHIADSLIADNHTAGSGGALDFGNGFSRPLLEVSLENVAIQFNSASGSGGAIRGEFGQLSILSSTLSDNQAGDRGGGLSGWGVELILEDSLVANNSSSVGGGLSLSPIVPRPIGPPFDNSVIRNTTISGNYASNVGGGLKHGGPNTPLPELLIEHSTITGNRSELGGSGIHFFGAPAGPGSRNETDINRAVVSHTIIAGNEGEDLGGDLSYVFGELSFRAWATLDHIGRLVMHANELGEQYEGVQVLFIARTSSPDTAVFDPVAKTLIITIGSFTLYTYQELASLINDQVPGFTAFGESSEIQGNQLDGLSSRTMPGVISITSNIDASDLDGVTFQVEGDSSISGISPQAVYDEAEHTVTVTISSSENTDLDRIAWAINSLPQFTAWIRDRSELQDYDVEVESGNTADFEATTQLQLDSTKLRSLGYNILEPTEGEEIFNQLGDQTGVTEILLGPLQDNGGPTFTHALLSGSPAIDMGDPSFTAPPDYDQRGAPFERIYNGRIDIGAFEIQPLQANVNGDNRVDGLDLLQLQRSPTVAIPQWEAEYGLYESSQSIVSTTIESREPWASDEDVAIGQPAFSEPTSLDLLPVFWAALPMGIDPTRMEPQTSGPFLSESHDQAIEEYRHLPQSIDHEIELIAADSEYDDEESVWEDEEHLSSLVGADLN